ncbi:hypothetical protein CTZ27_34525 [Streptomyces griseocarneus]|nr:hypothetical protein CTZ27_34525 [Streptomyces griseocarneus]
MSAERPLTRTERRATLSASLAGAVCAIAAAYLLLVTVPGMRAEERAFRTAIPCRSDAVDRRCLRPEAATVDMTEEVVSGKSVRHWLSVTQDDGTRHRIEMAVGGSVWSNAKPGDRVTVIYWHGKSRFVDAHNLRAPTEQDPRGNYRLPYSIALGLVPVTALCLWIAYWYGRRSRTSPLLSPWQVAVPTGGALILALGAAATPWLVHGAWMPLLITAGLAVPVVIYIVMASLAARREWKTTDTYPVRPLTSMTEEIFGGQILGDVPYAVSGYTTLIAGPGARFASSPDPTGKFARREAAPTLTALRTRPPYRTDSEKLQIDPRAYVVECVDGDKKVLVITDEKHAPLVMGALLPKPGATPGTAPAAPTVP